VEAAALGQLLRIRRDGNLHNVLLVNAKGVLPVAQTVFQSTLRARRRNREEFLQRLRRDVARLLRESPHFAPGDRVYLFGSRATDAWGGTRIRISSRSSSGREARSHARMRCFASFRGSRMTS